MYSILHIYYISLFFFIRVYQYVAVGEQPDKGLDVDAGEENAVSNVFSEMNQLKLLPFLIRFVFIHHIYKSTQHYSILQALKHLKTI